MTRTRDPYADRIGTETALLLGVLAATIALLLFAVWLALDFLA